MEIKAKWVRREIMSEALVIEGISGVLYLFEPLRNLTQMWSLVLSLCLWNNQVELNPAKTTPWKPQNTLVYTL